MSTKAFSSFGWKIPIKDLERFSLHEPAFLNAPSNARFELVRDFEAQHMLEQGGCAGPLARRPREPSIEIRKRARQSKELKVSSQSIWKRLASS